MTYTQYEINDWSTYFDAGWFTHYDKIVLPCRTLVAKDTNLVAMATTSTSVSPLAAPCLRTSCLLAVPCRPTLARLAAKFTVSTKFGRSLAVRP